MQKEELILKIIGANHKHSAGLATLQSFNRHERLVRAFKKLGAYWVVAILSIPIPALHFVLVPGFLIGGVVAFVLTYKMTNHLQILSFNCPLCEWKLNNDSTSPMWPISVRCSNCGSQVYIQDAALPTLIEIESSAA